jgi:hypothetical protein
LLDVNNVYVSAMNLDFDPIAYLDAIPVERVGQIHLAGFSDMGSHLFDTHSRPVSDEVWRLYAYVVEHLGLGDLPTMIEWDDDIPAWSRLIEELDCAREVCANGFERPEVGHAVVA